MAAHNHPAPDMDDQPPAKRQKGEVSTAPHRAVDEEIIRRCCGSPSGLFFVSCASSGFY